MGGCWQVLYPHGVMDMARDGTDDSHIRLLLAQVERHTARCPLFPRASFLRALIVTEVGRLAERSTTV